MYKLAVIFGEPNVDRLAAAMTSEQITEWQAYYNISPWDMDRIEYHFAAFMRLYASAHRRKGTAQPKFEDFLMFLAKSDEEKEAEDFDRFFNAHR